MPLQPRSEALVSLGTLSPDRANFVKMFITRSPVRKPNKRAKDAHISTPNSQSSEKYSSLFPFCGADGQTGTPYFHDTHHHHTALGTEPCGSPSQSESVSHVGDVGAA